jgi:hypothetical protein
MILSGLHSALLLTPKNREMYYCRNGQFAMPLLLGLPRNSAIWQKDVVDKPALGEILTTTSLPRKQAPENLLPIKQLSMHPGGHPNAEMQKVLCIPHQSK